MTNFELKATGRVESRLSHLEPAPRSSSLPGSTARDRLAGGRCSSGSKAPAASGYPRNAYVRLTDVRSGEPHYSLAVGARTIQRVDVVVSFAGKHDSLSSR